MGKRKHQGRFKPHDYPDGGPKKTPKKHGGNDGSGHHDRAPRYLTLAEGQKTPEIRALLMQRFARLTVMVYGHRLSGTYDFENADNSGTPRPPQNDLDPLETFGKIYAGDIFTDLFAHNLVCTGAKFRSRDEVEFGDKEGKNYLFFQRRDDIRPDPKTGKKYYLRPRWADYVILQADLTRQQIHKAQLFLTVNSRGGTKHTLKLFTGGTPRSKQLVKPIWKTVAQQWMLEPVVPAQPQL